MGICMFMRKGEERAALVVLRSYTVKASDEGGYLSALLGSATGTLTVDGQIIYGESTDLMTTSSKVEIVYTLAKELTSPRTIVVNGAALGTVSAVGATVSTTVSVSGGDTITVEFQT